MIGLTAPAWAAWSSAAAATPWSVGIEEEVMLLDATDLALASRVDDVLAAATPEVAAHLSQETHGSAVELATDPHERVPDALAQLALLRDGLGRTLHGLGMCAALAGTHPFATWQDIEVSAGERQQAVHRSLRELARREPTFALHVHVAVPDPEDAVRAMGRMRAHAPMLLALSANSPFWAGRDTGLASARVPLFDAFPRSGLPRAFSSYGELVAATDALVRSGAVPEPTWIWWDLRLQPRFGTLEVRIMDAQADVARTGALAALVQALVRVECEPDGLASQRLVDAPEVLDENRFLALRDGVDARLIDPDSGTLVPVRDLLARTLEACGGAGEELGSTPALEAVELLVTHPAPARQRAAAAGGLEGVARDLAGQF